MTARVKPSFLALDGAETAALMNACHRSVKSMLVSLAVIGQGERKCSLVGIVSKIPWSMKL